MRRTAAAAPPPAWLPGRKQTPQLWGDDLHHRSAVVRRWLASVWEACTKTTSQRERQAGQWSARANPTLYVPPSHLAFVRHQEVRHRDKRNTKSKREIRFTRHATFATNIKVRFQAPCCMYVTPMLKKLHGKADRKLFSIDTSENTCWREGTTYVDTTLANVSQH